MPKALASASERASRAKHLGAPHVVPINDLVDEIGRAMGWANLPYIDPTFGGINSRALLVMKAPEEDADPSRTDHRFLSFDNNDDGAANMFEAFQRRGLARSLVLPWNVCPFPIVGYTPNAVERRRAAPFTRRLLGMLPALEVVVTLGGPARDGWRPSELHPGRKLNLIAGASPSPPGINTLKNRQSFDAAIDQLTQVLNR
ncbi:hypothetical protein GCM10011410_29320 [Hoyosella rhizosphaerae]|uniref:Uracil-DNA glycosylase-like domain-containing protein n=2 Tax=Hoyosella rhizosphaerae TaxID=1755582 RepID=A0A916UIE6_9ACTN|nr:hypothetical protein GCM10011410_29320 [Hoyosella rhizosphaerae]